MEAINPSIKINHPSVSDANRLFRFYSEQEVLVPLCKEAEANVPRNRIDRPMALVQKVVDSVYNAARAWKTSIPSELSYSSSLAPLDMTIDFFATQKANHVYQNLRMSSKGTQAGEEFVQSKFKDAEGMYKFFEDKKVIEIKRLSPTGIAHWETLQYFTPSDNAHLSLQNCGCEYMPSAVNNNLSLKHLDVSYNPMESFGQYFHFVPQLLSLNLSYNRFEEVPSNLPASLQELRLSGNPIKTLGAFKGLKNLQLLDISYMSQVFRIDEEFWGDVNNLKIVISPDMRICVPGAAREKVFVVSSLNEQVRLIYDENGFIGAAQSRLSINSQQSSRRSLSHHRHRIIWPLVGLISAVIGVFAFVALKLWPRARSS